MRVGVIQSCYVPWRGYFDFIASVDRFVLYDDVQYSRGSWRNRNRLKTRNGLRWLTVPVDHVFGQRIDEVRIGASTRGDWRGAHERQLRDALGPAPHFETALALWRDATAPDHRRLTDLNEALLRAICGYLGITTPIERSSAHPLRAGRMERLLDLLVRTGATTYVSGPSARDYLDEPLLAAHGIALEYKTYDYAPYPQLWGPFEGAVTILDLIANCGPEACAHLRAAAAPEPSDAGTSA